MDEWRRRAGGCASFAARFAPATLVVAVATATAVAAVAL